MEHLWIDFTESPRKLTMFVYVTFIIDRSQIIQKFIFPENLSISISQGNFYCQHQMQNRYAHLGDEKDHHEEVLCKEC